MAPAVDERADLALNFVRQLGQRTCKFGADNRIAGNLAVRKALESLER